jgi:hypothetical protein
MTGVTDNKRQTAMIPSLPATRVIDLGNVRR